MSNYQNQVRLMGIVLQMGITSDTGSPCIRVQGPPGIGKTAIFRSLAAKVEKMHGLKNYGTEIMSASTIGVENISGLSYVHEGKLLQSMDSRIRSLAENSGGILCLDEVTTAPPDILAAMLSVMQDRRAGTQWFNKNVTIAMLYNHPDEAVNGRPFDLPTSNRGIEINMSPVGNEAQAIHQWLDYMQGGPGMLAEVEKLEPGWEENHLDVSLSIVHGFLKKKYTCFMSPPKNGDTHRPWSSPRSWETFTRVLAACMGARETLRSDVVHLAAEGCLGEDVAAMFMQEMRDLAIPDPEAWLAGEEVVIPTRDDFLRIALCSVAATAQRECPERATRWNRAWEILAPFLEGNKKDIAWDAGQTLASKKPAGAKIPQAAIALFQVRAKAGIK
jgi:hypothetical protein